MSLLTQQLPFLFFAFVASITPGPTNILILSNSQRYGTRATLPAVVGACLASSAIVLMCGVGPGEALRHAPLACASDGACWRAVADVDELAAVPFTRGLALGRGEQTVWRRRGGGITAD